MAVQDLHGISKILAPDKLWKIIDDFKKLKFLIRRHQVCCQLNWIVDLKIFKDSSFTSTVYKLSLTLSDLQAGELSFPSYAGLVVIQIVEVFSQTVFVLWLRRLPPTRSGTPTIWDTKKGDSSKAAGILFCKQETREFSYKENRAIFDRMWLTCVLVDKLIYFHATWM